MRQTYLSTPDDLEWLRDTHLKTCTRLPPFVVAVLDGTEDWPTAITLYEVDHYNSLTMTLQADENGEFHCQSERY
jgi:hypothetical protein